MQEQPEHECADSPPTRRRVSRWQQLKALADGHNSIDTDQGSGSPADVSPGKQLLSRSSAWASLGQPLSTGSQDVSDDVADVLARCAEQGSAAACTSRANAEPDSSQLHILPGGSLAWGSTGPERRSSTAGDTLLQLLQPDLSSSLDALQTLQGTQETVRRNTPRAGADTAGQQQLDLTGVFDYLHNQQQQHPKRQSSRTPASRAAHAPGRRQAPPSSSATIMQKQAQSHSSSWGAPRRPAPSLQQPARATTHSTATVTPAQQAQQLRSPAVGKVASISKASSRQGSAVPAAAVAASRPRPAGFPTASSSAIPATTPSSSSRSKHAAAGTCSTRQALTNKPPAAAAARPSPAATAAVMQSGPAAAAKGSGPLQQELSTCSSSHSCRSTMQECQAELQLELAAVLMFRVLRRWRLAAADVALDRARARPMNNLLSKRKAVRAWRMAVSVSREMPPQQKQQCDHQQQQALLPADSQQQQRRHQQQQQQQQSQQQQQQLQPQASQGGVNRAQVACQFHRLYRQHCCLLHWHAWAVAAAEARRQQQELEHLQERQRAVAAQQEALLAEFQQRQQQELQQQQEHTRMQVATRFHALYMLHSALRTWHKNASMTAALNKLHPVLPPRHTAAAATATSYSPGQKPGYSSSNSRSEGEAGAAAGMLDPALIQQKAQQLLQHLASRKPGAEPQQQQQQQQQQSKKLPQQEEAQQKPGPSKGASVQQSKCQAGCKEVSAGYYLQPGPSSAAAVQSQGHSLPRLQPATAAVGDHSAPAAAAAAAAAAAVRTDALGTAEHDVQQQQQTCRIAVPETLAPAYQQQPAEAAGVAQPMLQEGSRHSVQSSCSLQECDADAVSPVPQEQLKAAACAAPTEAVATAAAAAGPELQQGSGSSMHLVPLQQLQAAAQDALQAQQDQQLQVSSDRDNPHSKEQLQQRHEGSPPKISAVDMQQQPSGASGPCLTQQQQPQTEATDSPGMRQPHRQQPAQQPRLSAASQRLKALSKARHSSPQKRQVQALAAPTVHDAPAAEQCAAHADGTDLQDLDSQQTQQQQKQQDWPQERQRLQQQIRQLQAEEQRRSRQYQLVEQQLQALLAQQQAAVAEVHACRALVMRAGLGPWLRLMRQRAQQWQLAGRLYKWHLLNAAMGAFKHALVVRYKRHTCRHVQAWGKLRAVRQQHQQQAALSALAAWAHAGRHYRRQLVRRSLHGWREAAADGVQWLAAAAAAMRGLRQHQVVAAWWQYVQDQAHDQLMVELELTSVAANWHTARLQRCALGTWRTNAAAAAQQRLQEAAHQQTWSRVRGWLTELDDGGVQGPGGGLVAGCEAGGGAAASAGVTWGVPGGAGAPAAAAEGGDSTGWDLDVDEVFGVGAGAVQHGASGSDYGSYVGDVACDEEDGLVGGVHGGTGAVGDLAALADWFEAAGRSIQVPSECSGT